PVAILDRTCTIAGHSQGILSAVCLAVSPTMDSFWRNMEQLIRILYVIGLYAQKEFKELDGNDGKSYMLSISGLSLEVLQAIVNSINTQNKESDLHLQICIRNSP